MGAWAPGHPAPVLSRPAPLQVDGPVRALGLEQVDEQVRTLGLEQVQGPVPNPALGLVAGSS